MTWLKDVALPALGKGWKAVVAFVSWGWAKLRALFDTIVNPPPQTFRVYFWCAFALIAFGAVSYAFVNSWYYKPAIAFLTGDDGDVELPKLEPLPAVPTPATVLPTMDVVCHDASDTPHCEPVKPEPVVVTVLPPPKAEPVKPVVKKKRKVRKAKPVQHEQYWPF